MTTQLTKAVYLTSFGHTKRHLLDVSASWHRVLIQNAAQPDINKGAQIKGAFPFIINRSAQRLQLAMGKIDTPAPSGGTQLHALRNAEQLKYAHTSVCETHCPKQHTHVDILAVWPHDGAQTEGALISVQCKRFVTRIYINTLKKTLKRNNSTTENFCWKSDKPFTFSVIPIILWNSHIWRSVHSQ